MGKSKKKIDLVALIVFGVLVAAIVLAVVGICIDWTSSTATILGSSKTTTAKLSDLAESFAKLKETKDTSAMEGYGAMAAFAYISLALTILTAIVFVVSKFANIKVLKWVVVGVAALTVVSAVVSIATTYGFCSNYAADFGVGNVNIASSKTVAAAGPWLLFVGSVIAGGSGIAGALKK